MSMAARLAAFVQVFAAAFALGLGAVALLGTNRATILFPDALVAAIFAIVAALTQLRGGIRAALFFGSVAAILLAWVPVSGHWIEVGIRSASGPCPPFAICKPVPPVSSDERATLYWTGALSLPGMCLATAGVALTLWAAGGGRSHGPLPAAGLFIGAAIAAFTAAVAPWLAGGPPFGFDDRASFFTVFAEMAGLGAAVAAVAAFRNLRLAAVVLALASAGLLVFIIIGLPFTERVITMMGQQLPFVCDNPPCERPGFNEVENAARTLMLPLTALGVIAEAAAIGFVLRPERV